MNCYDSQHKMLTDRIQAQELELERLRKLVFEDELTGLGNRRMFHEELEAEIARASRYGTDVALLCCDLDSFKAVNDRFGHPAGDALLQRIGDILASNLRQPDRAARLGGDEFAVIMPHTSLNGGAEVADRLDKAIRKIRLPHQISASIGVASITPADHHGNADSLANALYSAADRALYDAKLDDHNSIALASDFGHVAACA